jgi:hypothetical protein
VRQRAPPPEGALMLQEQRRSPESSWSECSTVSTPALAASSGSGDGPADLWSARCVRTEFRLPSELTTRTAIA